MKTPNTHVVAGVWHIHGDELSEIVLLKRGNDACLQGLIVRYDVPNV
jgi:hypothetical protein